MTALEKLVTDLYGYQEGLRYVLTMSEREQLVAKVEATQNAIRYVEEGCSTPEQPRKRRNARPARTIAR